MNPYIDPPGQPLRDAGTWDAALPCILIAPGPSLRAVDLERIDRAAEKGRCRVFAVGDAWMQSRTAEVLYHADGPWWDLHKGCPTFTGRKITQNRNEGVRKAQHWGLECVTIRPDVDGMPSLEPSFDPAMIGHGCHSGFQALNIAVLMGSRFIALVGHDARLGDRGEVHNFGNHPPEIHRQPMFRDWIVAHRAAAPVYRKHGVTVVNCSRQTALDAYERRQLEDVI